jgi:hypothetical protein
MIDHCCAWKMELMFSFCFLFVAPNPTLVSGGRDGTVRHWALSAVSDDDILLRTVFAVCAHLGFFFAFFSLIMIFAFADQ